MLAVERYLRRMGFSMVPIIHPSEQCPTLVYISIDKPDNNEEAAWTPAQDYAESTGHR